VTGLLRMLSIAVTMAMTMLACVAAGASPLFNSDTILEAEITGPFSELLRNKYDREEMAFVLGIGDEEHSVAIRTRGNSRLRVCDFPPLRLNFSADQVEGTMFAGQDKLKLISHCDNNARFERYLLSEYAAYKIFNLLSENSYNVRLIRISYVDNTSTPVESIGNYYAVILESSIEFGVRTGQVPIEATGVRLGGLDHDQAALVFVFQYLIGNTDWSLVRADGDDTCCHNIDLYERESAVQIIPYDFDLAGIVDASYAKPDPKLGLRNVTARRYRGYCIPEESVRAALNTIKNRRLDILAVFDDMPGLTQDGVEEKSAYLKQFFSRAEDADKILQMFERQCQ
jgi:hypothetical protein